MTKNGKDKLRVGIIFGGRSGEHEVSLNSAQSVMRALNLDKYDVIPIGIDKNGRWLTGDVIGMLTEGKASSHPATLLPDPKATGLMQLDEGESVGITPALSVVEAAVSQLDVIFPVLHGPYGEDGTVQGLLELANLPYVGAGVVGSAVGMDKAIFKQVMTASGLPVLPWLLVQSHDWRQRPYKIIEQIEAILTYPLFTKPANLGSSVGISKCASREELQAGLDEAASYDRRIVVEQGVNVRELEVSVLGNAEPIASVVGEVRPRREFYDYVAKYVSDDSELIIPADLTEAQSDEVRRLAVQAYKAIDCAGLGRVDLLLDVDNGRFYLNEINTIPGFTQISMYPKLWEATGLPYSQLLDKLIALAIERHEEKESLKKSLE
ncbi:D-alanine--D-alanine ligase family protein [Candidatus Leptofilum sp.]|uniref:D-alanine--D-alanine ligase family protein n=1 Tax=Candidatus Leptofilum sp. TaxID=3241576 RepID=UPI003B5A7B61